MEENGLPSTPPVNKPSTTPSDKKLAAGLTAVLLGSLGIHKFILGYQTQGIIMLLISVVGALPTCGWSAGAMGVIGLVEGIIYLTKTDEEFDAMYVTGRKPWF